MGLLSGVGVNQGDLIKFLENTITIANEVKADVDAMKKTIEAICTQLDADTGVADTSWNSKYKKGGSDTDALPVVITAADLSLDV